MGESLKGKISRQPSYMMVVPINIENIINPEFIYYNLRNSKEFKTLNIYFDSKKKCPGVKIEYNNELYDLKFSIENFNIPKGYNLSHYMSVENIEALKKVNVGITTNMTFSDDIVQSYFLQLKVLNCMVPDNAGIIDFSAEKIYSPIWVSMACESSVAPALTYMYSIQAVGGKEYVWIHTHGLKRCGFVELEILGSTKENYITHCSMLSEMASSVISNNSIADEFEPIFVAKLLNGDMIINTWVDYKKGLKMFNKDIIGGINERKKTHNKNFAMVFNYPSKSDYERRNIVKFSDLDDDFFKEPLIMITNEETKRMSVLAYERYEFLKDYFNKSDDFEAIIKVRLKVDDDKKEFAGTEYEHIWFNVNEINEDKIICVLAQEPFYIENIHKGDEMEISKDDISDWKLFYKDNEITPDSCYLLVDKILDIKS